MRVTRATRSKKPLVALFSSSLVGRGIGGSNLGGDVVVVVVLLAHFLVLLVDLFVIIITVFCWRIPSRQQCRPYNTRHQDNIELMPNGHESKIQQLHGNPEDPLPQMQNEKKAPSHGRSTIRIDKEDSVSKESMQISITSYGRRMQIRVK
jgi:hypothetical protein